MNNIQLVYHNIQWSLFSLYKYTITNQDNLNLGAKSEESNPKQLHTNSNLTYFSTNMIFQRVSAYIQSIVTIFLLKIELFFRNKSVSENILFTE